MSNGKLMVVAGGQFGSEAKGHVAKRLLDRELAAGRGTTVVRVGGPNAGHTVLDASGVAWPLRQVPIGAVVPEASLVIAAGSEIDLDVLEAETTALREGGHDVAQRLWVDTQATILTHEHIGSEKGSDITARVGSTSKGIGAARAARIMRTAQTVGDSPEVMSWMHERGICVVPETGRMVSQTMQNFAESVIIEGTQGYGLGLHAGYYPQCTSGDCRAIDFAASAGIMPWNAMTFEPWVVVRPYPIRVAGNSGPLLGETTWEELGLPEEKTTVTKKVRRVGKWDHGLVRDAVMANGGGDHVKIAFTMADQVCPGVAGIDQDDPRGEIERGERLLEDWIYRIESTGALVDLITTGPNTGWFRE